MGNDGRGERGRWTETEREQKMPLWKKRAQQSQGRIKLNKK